MQYEITLPADYDMEIIRHRVRSKGHLLDAFPGLGLKSYGIRTRGQDGSSVNQYSPFYVWVDTAGMNRFLWGGAGFGGIVASFGRPRVQHWTGVAFRLGPAARATPRGAVEETTALPPEVDPTAVVAAARGELDALAATPGVHSSVLAVDPYRWQLVRYTLWQDETPAGAGARYQVLHLCKPDLPELVDQGR